MTDAELRSKKLNRTILETATWIERVNPDYEENGFRSVELKPVHYLYDRNLNPRQEILNRLIKRRSEIIEQLGIPLLTPDEVLQGGRMIKITPTKDLQDSQICLLSNYLFDRNQIPSWDTWIHIENGHLFSWVPNRLLNQVYTAQKMNFVGGVSFDGPENQDDNPFVSKISETPSHLQFDTPKPFYKHLKKNFIRLVQPTKEEQSPKENISQKEPLVSDAKQFRIGLKLIGFLPLFIGSYYMLKYDLSYDEPSYKPAPEFTLPANFSDSLSESLEQLWKPPYKDTLK